MHFLFRLDLSLYAGAEKKFGILNLVTKHGLSNLHAFQSGVLYMAETATVTRGRAMHACALLTQCCHGRSSSSGLHAQAQRTGSWAQLPGPVLSKAGQQRYGGGVREKRKRGGEERERGAGLEVEEAQSVTLVHAHLS